MSNKKFNRTITILGIIGFIALVWLEGPGSENWWGWVGTGIFFGSLLIALAIYHRK